MSDSHLLNDMTDELCEANLSAMIDGELEPESLLATLDHMVANKSCREFYRDARQLQDRYGAGHFPIPVKEASLPENGWHKIEQKSLDPGARILQLFTRTQVWATAAAILLVLGLWGGGIMEFHRPVLSSKPTEITLGEDEGRMSEQRFVELTSELLRSDRRYRRKMMEVLEEVDRVSYTSEGTPEGGSKDRSVSGQRGNNELPGNSQRRNSGGLMEPVIRLW